MNRRSPAALVGVLAVLGGVAGLAGFVVPGLNATSLLVVVAGLVAGVQGLRYALERRRVDYRAADAGDPERRHRVPVPGDDADRELDRAGGSSGRRSTSVRSRLREAAVETLVLHGDCSVEEAERRLDAGTWTADPVAARFLGADVSVPLRERVGLLVRRETSAPARARRAVAAVEALAEDPEATGARR